MSDKDMAATILVVDDEQGMLEVCADTLELLPDTEVILEGQSARALERLKTETFDLLIADVCMPGLNGVELLRQARERDSGLAALMITAHPTVETAVECMKLGAADYITKPFSPEELLSSVKRLLEEKFLREENRMLRRQVQRNYSIRELFGRSAIIQQILVELDRIAQTDLDVLITGETGTGKELVARALHKQSRRRDGPFVPVDCGAIPEDLLESEFFGHERGAFTGAHTRGIGLMEFAKGGVFFLDEIGQLTVRLQAKLLRVLQERSVRRVGGTKEIPIDIRVVAATSLDLEEEVHRQRFRLDLLHRINEARLDLPPLRDRADDIPVLVEAFVARFCRECEKPAMQLTPEALEIMLHYAWPGNVRELKNVVKRAVALSDRPEIGVEELPDALLMQAAHNPAQLREGGFFDMRERRTAIFEKEYFRDLLSRWNGDVAEAAREAQLPRGSLYRLLKKHGMDPGEFRP